MRFLLSRKKIPLENGHTLAFYRFFFYNKAMSEIIQPRVLKGFRDFLPQDEIMRADLIEKLTKTFRSYGFVPIDTPVLEYTEILLRKSNGETEKQVFRFEDNGHRDVAMRFDLTVPFARFTAEHKEELYVPFKRYHIAKVWRGEKPQAGRYREFVQCDFDTVGSDSAVSDFETLALMKAALSAIGVEKIHIHLNHRGIFNCFLKTIGALSQSEAILREVDKLAKEGKETVSRNLLSLFEGDSETEKTRKVSLILDYISAGGNFLETLSHIATLAGEEASGHVARVKDIYDMLCATGIEKSYVLDPAITRGLDYYTGVVYETFLDELPSIGSVCSGGRYDNLSGLYMKEKVPGVGSSIGLDRLIAALSELGEKKEQKSYVAVEIYNTNASSVVLYEKIAQFLRAKGIAAEVFPDCVKMAKQYTLTEKKGIPWGITVSKEEEEKGLLTVKDLRTREQFPSLTLDEAAKKIANAAISSC